MAAVTDEDFENLVDSELGWRRIELNALANQMQSASRLNSTSPTTRALARGMITLLYAHWEGFCKSVFESYIKLVVKRKPPLKTAADSFALAHVTHLIRRMDSGDLDAAAALLEIVRGTSTERLRLSQDRIVDTKSNLRFAVFESIMASLSIPSSDFATKRNLIDIQLCDHRNDIAHGRANFPATGQVLELHGQVLELMESVRDLTITQVRMKSYYSSTP